MKRFISFICICLVCFVFIEAKTHVVEFKPTKKKSYTSDVNKILSSLKFNTNDEDTIVINFKHGVYDLYPESKYQRTLYISNHDQDNPKSIGLILDRMNNIIINGNGSELLCHGHMLPIAIINCKNITINDLNIDFETPHIAQVEIVNNDTINGIITYKPESWVKYHINDSKQFIIDGENWQIKPLAGIAFDKETKHIIYRTSDIAVGADQVNKDGAGNIVAPWRNNALIPGSKIAMRSYDRPCPGIFVNECENVSFINTHVHYAEGMGLLAQLTKNILLDGFQVSIKSGSGRYFTTQADATHFSSCKGQIRSINGLYEGMMDDAINVHGTYLKIIEKCDDTSVLAQYMHNQSYGFKWGECGDTIRIVASSTMDTVPGIMILKNIVPYDKETIEGTKIFKLQFDRTIPETVTLDKYTYGVENLTWTPSVLFANNVIRNNRARGSLFSTPRHVEVFDNIFDHTSGSAILLSGDCNGWFETGACRDVYIHNNKFINALTNLFQFTNAVISIYPEIPNLKDQMGFFHSGIKITDNYFDTFDIPLLYAKSVDGLIFLNNTVHHNNDFPAFHHNDAPIWLERVTNAKIQ